MVELVEGGDELLDERERIEGLGQNSAHGQTHEPRAKFDVRRDYDDDRGAVLSGDREQRSCNAHSVEPRHHEVDDEGVDRLPFEHFERLDTICREHHIEVGDDEEVSH
jgi:hypothetical protein